MPAPRPSLRPRSHPLLLPVQAGPGGRLVVAGTGIAFPGDNCFEPHGIDISEDGRTLYVACAGGAWIYTVDGRTVRPSRVVVTAPGAIGVAVDAPHHEVWLWKATWRKRADGGILGLGVPLDR